jgi:hypothetical protein
MHPPLFTEAGEPLEADHWLRAMESKIGLLRCTEVQKTLFATQQLWGDASAWWANYTATRPADYQVLWAEFRNAFCAYYIPAGVMRKKRQEFMDLNQGVRSVHDYSKQFSHLAQYALDQVDTDEKKKDRFMIGLSTKLQERMALNTGGMFPEFVSNVMITDDAIRAIRKPRRGRLWPLHPVVLLRSTGRCTTTTPPIHLGPSISSSVCSSSGLPAHLSVSTSGQHQGLYLHLRQ